jgi:bifunctional non-homologous end joining protein LigD
MTPRPKLAFVPPSLPTLVAKSPVGDEWLHEVKHDGYRAIAVVEEGRARVFSRRPYTAGQVGA